MQAWHPRNLTVIIFLFILNSRVSGSIDLTTNLFKKKKVHLHCDKIYIFLLTENFNALIQKFPVAGLTLEK